MKSNSRARLHGIGGSTIEMVHGISGWTLMMTPSSTGIVYLRVRFSISSVGFSTNAG
ncbi:MAG TPA: hypothetical protein PKH54_02330 [Myxococcota bacterium]|nr:hypothetical protein [Myxococcota bacterium]HOC98752.1 hypothetical protein [Myxococcota bacterium]HOH77804.1 hypothetical protein [Myxococcota bacterium]